MSHSLLARRLRLLTLLTVCLGCTLVLGLIFRPPAEEPVPALEPAAVEVPLPLSGLRILVDPGHGGYDGGARAGTAAHGKSTSTSPWPLRLKRL